MWYYVKDPNHFDLKSPRRWNPAGVKLHPPRPFYNREDGHFLLNNTCTIANLCLMPELRRLQCYFFSILPKVHVDRNFYLPMKKELIDWIFMCITAWQTAHKVAMDGNMEAAINPLVYQSTPRILNLPHLRLQNDTKNGRRHYRMNREVIDRLRAWHRRKRGNTPPPEVKPVDYHVPCIPTKQLHLYSLLCSFRAGKESVKFVRKVKELFEDPFL